MKRDGSQVFHVSEEEVGLTLAGLLKKRLPELSWNQARKQIHGRRIQIHGNLCVDEGRRLQTGEVVKLLAQAQAAPPRDDDVRIRYVDAHLAVIEKPAGMTTLRHSEERFWPDHRKQRQPTLDEVLARLLAQQSSRRAPRPGTGAGKGKNQDARPKSLPVRPVHRLDRETSGLMVFARTVPAERGLVQQFRKHTIHRAYVAVAHGNVAAQTISTQLVRDRGDGRRGGTKLPGVGQRAVTHVRPLERLGGYTVVACRLETGRTHQIRIHLAESGHFICGDKVYCQPLFQKPLVDRSGAPRVALHAAELGFVHPITGEVLRFTMPVPPDLLKFLNRLRQDAGQPAAESPIVPAEGWPATLDHGPPDDEFEEPGDDIPPPAPTRPPPSKSPPTPRREPRSADKKRPKEHRRRRRRPE